MKKLGIFPTWIAVQIMRPALPKDHPWKYKMPSLSDWTERSTSVNWIFSALFWLCGMNLMFLIIVRWF